MLLGVDGISDFDGLHSRKHNDEVQFYAFDMLVTDGEDIRKLPLTMRKTNFTSRLTHLSSILGTSLDHLGDPNGSTASLTGCHLTRPPSWHIDC